MVITNFSNKDLHFSGHETFPLRQMWLKKVYDKSSDGYVDRSIFTDERAIARFGVGKNMVSAIRHWALACGVIQEVSGSDSYVVSSIAKAIYSDEGFDPYSEHPSTSWLAHWWLAGIGSRSTTWYWLFNFVNASTFTRDHLEEALVEFVDKHERKRKPTRATISRDIETCLRSYAPRPSKNSLEDLAEPMLSELGLLNESDGRGQFSFRRGPKLTLTQGMFAYILLDYWERLPESLGRNNSGSSSLNFETIFYEEGSPGRVLKLDEESIAEALLGLENLTEGVLAWTDTAGLRQVVRKEANIFRLKNKMLREAYQ